MSDDIPAATAANERVIGDLTGQTADGISVGVLLFQDEGKLSELEVYAFDYDAPFGLPTLESVGPFG